MGSLLSVLNLTKKDFGIFTLILLPLLMMLLLLELLSEKLIWPKKPEETKKTSSLMISSKCSLLKFPSLMEEAELVPPIMPMMVPSTDLPDLIIPHRVDAMNGSIDDMNSAANAAAA